MKKRNLFRLKEGFTLIEIMAALLITGILMVTVISILLMSQNVYSRGGDISYKHKSITNIETDLQNALATATSITVDSSQPTTGAVYGLDLTTRAIVWKSLIGVAYQTDQITEIVLNTSGNTLNYEMVPKNSMSTLSGGIVMNNIKSANIDTTLQSATERYLVITLVD